MNAVSLRTASRKTGVWVFVIVVALFLFAPVVVVILFAFNGQNSTVALHGFSLQWFRSLPSNSPLMSAFGNTAQAAVSTVVIDEVIALPAALALARGGVRVRSVLRSFFSVTIIVPGLIVGVALIAFFSRTPYNLGLATLVLGHVLVTFPIVLLVLLARLERLDMTVIAAARDAGAGAFMAFRRVLLPLILPAIIGSALIAAAWSIDEFNISLFTNGGAVTVPVYLYSQLTKFGATPTFNATATIMIVVNVAAIIAASRFVRLTDLR